MIEFLTLKPKTFGLSISDSSLKIIKLKKKGKFLNLASWGKTEIRPGIVEEGEIKNEEEFVRVIKEVLNQVKGEKLKTNNVIISLPEKKAFFTVAQIPQMKEEELKSAILFEAENYIPFSIEEVYLDFQIVAPVHDHLNHIDVLLAALPKNIVDVYLSCFKKAGLIIQALEIESQSISRALVKDGLSPSPILIVDFGESITSFIIFSGYSLRFTSSTPISSYQLDEAISRSLDIDLKEAEKLKLKYGLRMSEEYPNSEIKSKLVTKKIPQKDIYEAIIPVLADLTGEIKRYLSYYQTHSSHEHLFTKNRGVQKIILSGKDANLKGLTAFLSSSLKIPVELGNPWVNILPYPLREVPELSFGESLGYTTALGLALRGIKE